MRMGFTQDGETVHPQLGRVRYKVHQMGDIPDGQVGQTIGEMQRRVGEDSQSPWFRGWAREVVGDHGTQLDKVNRAWDHVHNSIRFQRDEVTGQGIGGVPDGEVVETIIRPVDMAGYIQQGNAVGDCDDFSMYLAALLNSLGIECKFVTLAADGRAPGQFSHVYVVAYPLTDTEDGQGVISSRVSCDASHGTYCGWEAPNMFGRREEWGSTGSGVWGFVFGVAAAVGAWVGWQYLKKAGVII